MPIIYGAIWIGGFLAGSVFLDKAGDAMEGGSQLVRWVVIGGVTYGIYKVAQSQGVIK